MQRENMNLNYEALRQGKKALRTFNSLTTKNVSL